MNMYLRALLFCYCFLFYFVCVCMLVSLKLINFCMLSKVIITGAFLLWKYANQNVTWLKNDHYCWYFNLTSRFDDVESLILFSLLNLLTIEAFLLYNMYVQRTKSEYEIRTGDSWNKTRKEKKKRETKFTLRPKNLFQHSNRINQV